MLTTTEHYRDAIGDFHRDYKQHIEALLHRYFDAQIHAEAITEPRLIEAMRYSVLNGGKRLRALLVFAAAKSVGEPTDLTDAAAIALECIHAYSLIHDDLPAMDDDDLRRGQATCHIAFDEATAILAGDALQTSAFDCLSQTSSINPAQQLEMVRLLSLASGHKGMVSGQSFDLNAVNQSLHLEQLIQMHRLKTGALIRASVQLGAISTGVVTPAQQSALETYAEAIGLAFQIQDDILDVTSDTKTLGKQQGADEALNKPTFVSLMGLDQARKKADEYYATALCALDSLGHNTEHLRQLAAYIVKRNH